MPLLTNNGILSANADLSNKDVLKVVVGATGYTNFGGGTVSLVEKYGIYEKTIKTYTTAEAIPDIFEYPSGTTELRLTGATSPSLFLNIEYIS